MLFGQALDSFVPTQNNRGKLFYKDYRSYGELGAAALQGPNWNPPAEQSFAYTSGSKAGPYNVAGSSAGGGGKSLVFDFELDANEWVGAQIPLFPGEGTVNLSSLKGIHISYRTIDFSGPGNFNVYLQIGEIGEDLDGDAVLDAETTPSSSGFLFEDQTNSANLLVGGGPKGQGNSRIDSEDVDGNGTLDPETAGRILLISLPTISGDSTWVSFTDFFATDPNYKDKLISCRSIRITITNPGGSAITGRFLIDRIGLSGTAFGIKSNDSATEEVHVREIREIAALNEPPHTLAHAYPEVDDIFHPSGELQKVLEVDWSGYAAGED